MKNMEEIYNMALLEAKQWFAKQDAPFTDYYWYYTETTPEHDGGFLIAADKPANSDYAIAGRLRRDKTVEQNVTMFCEIARRLPILEYEQ